MAGLNAAHHAHTLEAVRSGNDGESEPGPWRGMFASVGLRSEGMHCPLCGYDDDKVVDSRSADAGSAIRRRRECLKCGGRYTTYERVVGAPLVVRKRSGALEPFRAEKLAHGIRAALGNGPVEGEAVEQLVRAIEDDMAVHGSPVTSDEIGIAVLERLRKLDPAAYLRFASVYKAFEAPEDFAREIRELAKVRKND